jgi:NTP pyrophosphatase (non-canonical NTP hydrolase)
MKDLKNYQKKLADFAKEREWDQFHSIKNLSMALSVEASELLEHFQWSKGEIVADDLTEEKRKKVEDELIDIFIYWVRLTDKMGLSFEQAFERKFKENCEKYPADKVKGKSKKYNEY